MKPSDGEPSYDRVTLVKMHNGLSDFIDNFRETFQDNSSRACETLASLLAEVHGETNALPQPRAFRVKPGFFIAARLLDLIAVGKCLSSLQAAIKGCDEGDPSHRGRAPVFLDRQSQNTHYAKAQREGAEKIALRVKYFSQLLNHFVAARNKFAKALAGDQNLRFQRTTKTSPHNARGKKKWADLLSLYDELQRAEDGPMLTQAKIVARYNQKYSRRKEKATVKKLQNALNYRRRSANSQADTAEKDTE